MTERFENIHELTADITQEEFLHFIRRNKLQEMEPSRAQFTYEKWAKENGIDIRPGAVMRFKDQEGDIHRMHTSLLKCGEEVEE